MTSAEWDKKLDSIDDRHQAQLLQVQLAKQQHSLARKQLFELERRIPVLAARIELEKSKLAEVNAEHSEQYNAWQEWRQGATA